eukprot:10950237-Ditylum_brightwellii.AAC.1
MDDCYIKALTRNMFGYNNRKSFNLSLPIEDFFEQMAVHNDTCKDWIHGPNADKTWANFRNHFTEAHQFFYELQQAAAQAGFAANNVMLEPSLHD